MELEDLVLSHYRVEKIDGKMVATEDANGKYRAKSGNVVERVLTEYKPTRGEVEVRIGKIWRPIIRVRF